MLLFKDSKGKLFQLFVALTANLMAITDGMAIGWTSPMLPYFLSDKTHIHMTSQQGEWLEFSLLIGSLVGMPFTAFCIGRIGRKKSLLLGTFIVMICWIIIAAAHIVELLYLARFLNGFGLNIAFISAPMYVGEIAQKKFRGFLSSTVFVMVLLGIALIYIIGPFVPFYVPSIISVVLTAIELIVFSFMPETPYYLALKNDLEAARKSLKKFRGGGDVEEELAAIKKDIDLENKGEGIAIRDIFFVKNYRKSLLIMLAANSAQLFCANDVFVMNLHGILDEAGSLYMDPRITAIAFSVINFAFSIVASLLVDRFGRKRLMIVSAVLTGINLLMIAIYFNLKNVGYDTLPYSWIPIATIMVYSACFRVGIGMVPFVLVAEIFAPKLKVIGMTFSDGVYVISSMLSLQVFFGFKKWFGTHIPFYIFFCYAIFTCLFMIFFLPETKGKSLDEIQEILRGSSSSNRESNNATETTTEKH